MGQSQVQPGEEMVCDYLEDCVGPVDQLQQFFEHRAARIASLLREEQFGADADALDCFALRYLNTCHQVEFHNEQIHFLMDGLLNNPPGGFDSVTLRMDITDRMTKRYFSKRERQEVATQCLPFIGRVELRYARRVGEFIVERKIGCTASPLNQQQQRGREINGIHRKSEISDAKIKEALKKLA